MLGGLKKKIKRKLRPPKLALVLCVYNEEKQLPYFLKYIEPYVDFIVALDDGSTDKTAEILRKSPKLKKLLQHKPKKTVDNWDDGTNREEVVRAARAEGADWVLAIDPDERPALNFLRDLRKIINEAPKEICYAVHFRELWGGIKQYRDDGVWGQKTRCLLFTVRDDDEFKVNRQKLHTKWHPDGLLGKEVELDYNHYHLKMVKPEDRTAWRDLYNHLDAKLEYQPIGYDYLTDEKGLHLSEIAPGEEYDYDSVPEDLRNYQE